LCDAIGHQARRVVSAYAVLVATESLATRFNASAARTWLTCRLESQLPRPWRQLRCRILARS
jgi:hypothetical protein